LKSFYLQLDIIIIDLIIVFSASIWEKAIMHEGFKIDKDLPSKLDNLLKEGCLDKETEILRILETLSEKLSSLENKEEDSTNQENELEKRSNRIHQKWGKDPFNQEK
jgi:hypothetical protein